MNIQGQSALVTGGASGLGAQTARWSYLVSSVGRVLEASVP